MRTGHTPMGTRVVLTVDLYDHDDETGRRFLAARAGQQGITVDAPPGFSDWPKVRLDGGKEVIVDMEAGEARVVTEENRHHAA